MIHNTIHMKKYCFVFLLFASIYSCKNVHDTSVTTNVVESKAFKKLQYNDTFAIPPESIFHLTDTFKTSGNKNFTLADLKGKPTVLAMIFTNCGYACPRLTSDINNIREKLYDNKQKINFVLVSFDTKRDTPLQLQRYAKQMELDSNWILLHGSDETVRTLSVLLNVQFEKDADGNFSHSNVITVLGKNGLINFRKEGLEVDHTETLLKLKTLIN